MTEGVESTLKALEGAKKLVVGVAKVVKDGVTLSDIPALLQVLADLKAVVDAAPKVYPEVKDLDATEVGLLAEAAYKAVVECIEAVKK